MIKFLLLPFLVPLSIIMGIVQVVRGERPPFRFVGGRGFSKKSGEALTARKRYGW
jgi:hypothetical protein